ncbi:hypothetical protein ACFQE1_19205 [Halobium palmae]|uniref:Uncharacterized protein n=1 Tax=Halobium palmae TaxID=1776492 RepID=A0ABD5S5L6_9EURY
MSETDDETPDIDELRERVADLRDAAAALREYGEDNEIPAVERNAKRVEGTVSVLEQHVPEPLDEE